VWTTTSKVHLREAFVPRALGKEVKGMFVRVRLLGAGLVLIALAVIVSPASAQQPECKAINQSQDVQFNSNNNADPLGAAISGAASGDTIRVMGTCTGNFVIDKDLTLRGRHAEKQMDEVNGGGSGTVLGIAGAFDLTLVDLTITGGTTGVGNDVGSLSLIRTQVTGNGGMGVANVLFGSTTTIEDSVISANAGLGVFNGRGELSISNSRVTSNEGGGVGALHNVIRITGSLIAGNTGGSGISTGDGAFISNSVIEGNTTDGTGGGVSSFGRVEITDSTISGNTAGQGGGIYNHLGTTLAITRSDVTSNHATGGAGFLGNGGGIYNDGALSLADSSVTGNTASAAGGGIFNIGTVTTSGTNSLCGNTPDDWPGC
jgi:hypothetical protein